MAGTVVWDSVEHFPLSPNEFHLVEISALSEPRVLLVDLNNFARYPSVAIGYLSAILKQGGYAVEVFAPLSTGLTGVAREPKTPWWGRANLEFRFRTGISRSPVVRRIRRMYATRASSRLARSKNEVTAEVARRLDAGIDVVLVSTYLMYHPHCAEIGRLCEERGVPLVVGGAYFHAQEVATEWLKLPGLSALIGAEVEPHLCEIVRRVIAGESAGSLPGVWSDEPLLQTAPGSLPGVFVQSDKPRIQSEPLKDLDSIPFADYSEFPWSLYPNVIVPIITGRGCGWGVCSFCSDITSTVGRTYRSRSPENVLAEIAHQHQKHGANLFVFVDLKLNSNVPLWRELIRGIQKVAPGSKWIAAVHVGARGDDGLSLEDLQRAREAGMVRITTGLEVGSQAVLDKMAKGTDLEITSQFLRDAKQADLSVQTTMMTGYPGESADDVDLTTKFLQTHETEIERVKMNRFQIMSGTIFARQLEKSPHKFPQVTDVESDHLNAQISHHYTENDKRDYRNSISHLLKRVHIINRKPLSLAASDFDGVM